MKKIAAASLAAAVTAGCNAGKDRDNESDLLMVVGTYTDTGSEGVYSYRFNQNTGDFELLDSCGIVNPSYLTVNSTGNRVYAVSETSDSTAAVYALSLDKDTGKMEILDHEPTVGTDPCYVATNGTVVVTANYGGSMSVFPLDEEGALEPLSLLVEGATGGPDTVRQIKPHVHCVEFTHAYDRLIASDFSADRLLLFNVDGDGHIVSDSARTVAIEVEPDAGPRHVVFSSDDKFAYLIGELSGRITVLERTGDSYLTKQVVRADNAGGRASADIHLAPDGKYLYASIRRANDGIAVFKVDPTDGRISPAGYVTTGLHPRNFAITPNGKFLLAACRDSNRIEIFEIDPADGLPKPYGKEIILPKPVCVKLVTL